MSMWAHPGRGRRLSEYGRKGAWSPPPDVSRETEPEPEILKIMSVAMWCDYHQGPYSSIDVDARAMSMEVPKIENGVKVGIAYTVERHQCGDCVRAEAATLEKRRAISAGAQAAEEHLRGAVTEAWADERAEVPRTFIPPGERADQVPPRTGYRMSE